MKPSLTVGLTVAAILLALVAGFAWRERSVAPEPVVGVSAPLTAAETASLRTWPSSRTALSPVDMRARIWDATDILAAVLDAQKNGTPDQKLWAADAERSCYIFASLKPAPDATGQPTPDYVVGEPARKAWNEMRDRCAGFNAMPWKERRALEKDLRDSAASSTSEFAQLHTLALAPAGSPLSDAQMAVVEKALYGDDPLLRREAALAITGAIPDQAKRLTMCAALAGIWPGPLSSFEVLGKCATGILPNVCPGDPKPALGPPPTNAPEDPVQVRIEQAIANKQPVSVLLALVN